MIDICFTLTEPEYLEAQKLYMKSRRRYPRWISKTLWVTLVMGTVITAFTAPRPWHLSTTPPYLILFLIACLYPLWLGPLQRRGFRKRFVHEKQNLTNAHVQIDDSGFHIEIPGVGSGAAEWTSMSKWMEGELVVILLTGLLMRIVPKQPLSESQLEELRQLLGRYVGPVTTGT